MGVCSYFQPGFLNLVIDLARIIAADSRRLNLLYLNAVTGMLRSNRAPEGALCIVISAALAAPTADSGPAQAAAQQREWQHEPQQQRTERLGFLLFHQGDFI